MAGSVPREPGASRSRLLPFEICRSGDVEEVRALLRERFGFGFEPRQARPREAQAAIACLDLPAISVHYAHYGTEVEITTPAARDDFMVLMPLAGQVVSLATGTPEPCTERRSVVSSPGVGGRTRSDARARRINLSIKRELLVRRLVDLIGEGVYDDIVLDRGIDYTTGFGKSLRSHVLWAVSEAERDAEWFDDPHTVRGFQDWIANGLLRFQRHTYSERLAESRRLLAPRDVRRVADYIAAHAEAPIGLGDLVAVSGVPERTLRRHFHDSYGLAPMAYLRRVRFERVRADLLRAEPDTTVTDVAWRWGFRSMGRFAVEYRRLFGERPSDTVRKRTTGPPRRAGG